MQIAAVFAQVIDSWKSRKSFINITGNFTSQILSLQTNFMIILCRLEDTEALKYEHRYILLLETNLVADEKMSLELNYANDFSCRLQGGHLLTLNCSYSYSFRLKVKLLAAFLHMKHKLINRKGFQRHWMPTIPKRSQSIDSFNFVLPLYWTNFEIC